MQKKKRSVWDRLYWSFWNRLRKIGVWDSCPNCDSAWTGGHPNPHTIICVVCGQDKKEKVPNGWVWGWVVPMWIQRRIVSRRMGQNRPLSDFGERNSPMTEKQLYHLWYSGQQQRATDLGHDLRGIAWYRLVETSEATTERHSEAIANGEEPKVAVTEASRNPTPSGLWDDYVYLGRGY